MNILVERKEIRSEHLDRVVTVDFYLPRPVENPDQLHLLLVNDGQNLEEMEMERQLAECYDEGLIPPLLLVGIHAGEERKMEYGVIGHPDYLERGAKAEAHAKFVIEELLPFIKTTYYLQQFSGGTYAGFSLGGLSALDFSWNFPQLCQTAGVFSGSLWWRSLDQDDPAYRDDRHRIMHQVIRNSEYRPGLRFFFQSGNMDETNDRNNNGIIDSIDDTLDMIAELEKKGYNRGKDIHYLEIPDGRHDIPTWARAVKPFLKWAFS